MTKKPFIKKSDRIVRETAYKIMSRAGDLLEAGWCQGRTHKCEGGKNLYCFSGAVRRALLEVELETLREIPRNGKELKMIDNLFIKFSDGARDWQYWNDHRTHDEVVGMARQIAGVLR